MTFLHVKYGLEDSKEMTSTQDIWQQAKPTSTLWSVWFSIVAKRYQGGRSSYFFIIACKMCSDFLYLKGYDW